MDIGEDVQIRYAFSNGALINAKLKKSQEGLRLPHLNT